MVIENVFPKLLPRKCEVCDKTSDIFRCSGCFIYFYCTRDHQTANWEAHKNTCKVIKKARKNVREAEEKLREHPGDDETPKGIFDAETGRFGLWKGAQAYVRARFDFSVILLRSYRRYGVEEALENFVDMLRLDRGDRLGARMLIPALFLRLGRDQECYDFLKWWAIKLQDQKGYDWYDMAEPFLDIKGADLMEPVELWAKNGQLRPDLPQAACLALLKIRLLQNLQGVQKFRGHLGPATMTPEELLRYEPLRSQLRGEWILSRPELVTEEALGKNIELVAKQMTQLLTAISEYNANFLPMLLEPTVSNLTGSLRIYYEGSESEAEMAVQYTYPAWCETEGSIQGLRNMFLNGMS